MKKSQPRKKAASKKPRPSAGLSEQYSQDEAATMIQKKYRGYQVRKQYGPLLSGDKMDEETIQFIRHYYSKWKAKSMFQVLLLYRAAKHQDLIYFGQQVHLYNNNTVGTLLIDMKEVVKLDLIQEGANPTKVLGPHKLSVAKLPFRLKDLPFLDNYAMSDPLARKGSQFGDDESWDIPLRRGQGFGFESMSGYMYRDQEVQTGLSEWKNDREITNEEENFIETPYCRDPKKVRSVYENQHYRQESIPPPREKERPSSRTSTKRKAPAPPQFQNTYSSKDYSQNFYENEPSPRTQSTQNEDYRDKYNTTGMKKDHDHILEMKTKGQVQTNNNMDDDTDDPPFNFQAMLRKTNHNRASLRRNLNNESTTYNYSNSGMNNTLNFNQRNLEQNNYKPVPKKRSSVNQNNFNSYKNYKMELAPGIILEGDVTDL